jgi:hypothetical protein
MIFDTTSGLLCKVVGTSGTAIAKKPVVAMWFLTILLCIWEVRISIAGTVILTEVSRGIPEFIHLLFALLHLSLTRGKFPQNIPQPFPSAVFQFN